MAERIANLPCFGCCAAATDAVTETEQNEKHMKTDKNAEMALRLGFNPTLGFVKMSGKRVGFTCGKPEEIRSLYRAVVAAGLTPSAALAQIGGAR